MKRLSIAAMVTMVYLLSGIGSASAQSYAFNWYNNLNHLIGMNARPSCTVTTEAKFGSKTQDTQTISLADGQKTNVTVTAATCTSVTLIAKCSFTDNKGTRKTETKTKLVQPCMGGDAIVLPDPDNANTYTSFGIEFLCAPPCK